MTGFLLNDKNWASTFFFGHGYFPQDKTSLRILDSNHSYHYLLFTLEFSTSSSTPFHSLSSFEFPISSSSSFIPNPRIHLKLKLAIQNREVEKSQRAKFGRVDFGAVNLANRLAEDTEILHAGAEVH